jgi:2-isopropylmalate synthase
MIQTTTFLKYIFMNQSIALYDTTLRDGTQGLGVSFSSLDKIRIAQRLDEFGMNYIEGGWPGSNPKDVEFFREAKKVTWKNAKIAAFGSTRRKDKPVAEDAQIITLLEAETPVVTVYGKSWDLHVTEVLNTTLEENKKMIYDTAKFFVEHGREFVYDAEHFFDGYKANAEYALQCLEAARDGGASVLVLCDTNGGTLPHEVAEITKVVLGRLRTPVGIHTHDDSGLGVANALASLHAGAVHVQGTVNGYGERTGNCNLTTVIPNLQLKMGHHVVPDLRRLTALSHFVDEMANNIPFTRAPFVGAASFAHKGGTHANAVQKLARSYEHIPPEEVGNQRMIVVSELAGGSNILMKAEEMGLALEKDDPRVRRLLEKVKQLENEGYEFEAASGSLELLIRRELGRWEPQVSLGEFHCSYRRDGVRDYESCFATLKVTVGGVEEHVVGEGDGPVNALDAALRRALQPHFPQLEKMSLRDYKVRIIDSYQGTAAKTRVLIESTDGTANWGTVGVSHNIIEASWQALIDSVELFIAKK